MNLRKSKTYSHKQLIKRCPLEIEKLILKYLDVSTRYCEDCDKITDCGDWLVKKGSRYIKEELFCPNCNNVCCNPVCVKPIHLAEDTTTVIKDDGDEVVYCIDCAEDLTYFCECCGLDKEKDEQYGEPTSCDDCDSLYCRSCVNNDAIFTCCDCGDTSCCRKFAKVDMDLICEGCIKWIKPHNYKENRFI